MMSRFDIRPYQGIPMGESVGDEPVRDTLADLTEKFDAMIAQLEARQIEHNTPPPPAPPKRKRPARAAKPATKPAAKPKAE